MPYSTYYKSMGDRPYISSEQGGLTNYNTYLAYIWITIYKHPIPIQDLQAEEGGGLIIIIIMFHMPKEAQITNAKPRLTILHHGLITRTIRINGYTTARMEEVGHP